jgi:SAM-dependent methyltransferase
VPDKERAMKQDNSLHGSQDVVHAAARLRDMIMGFRVTQLLHVAAKLNVADHLAAAPQSAEQLATKTGADPPSLGRIMRALTSIAILTETDGFFALTAIGHLLRRDVPGSLNGVAVLYGEEWLWSVYGRMLHSVQTGEAAFAGVHGMPFYEFLDTHPAPAMQFQAAMSAFSRLEAAAIAAAYDFAGCSTVVDVGGGNGTLLAGLLNAYPSLRGVVFDQPAVVADAEHVFTDAGVSGRARWIGGDFFSELPSDGDVYLLKSVLHNWPDRDARRILECCRRAMAPGTRLLVAERVVPADAGPSEAKLFDINMLVVVGGRERTEAEYRRLLELSGFTGMRVLETKSPISLIEAECALSA